ncbi:hypothetical protein ONS95_001133 [Cadophora gregata]|uniref:uncharacterized protein n=1 Tax=Cadophora gregata TaxID=51156 RepID=UPI0026DC6D3F|nr:uncharacterized protein ONS95_001133 [Cadophora gregata]KAK0129198.1 hypothetical protein ONS95_001133 [Cadophora gregata]
MTSPSPPNRPSPCPAHGTPPISVPHIPKMPYYPFRVAIISAQLGRPGVNCDRRSAAFRIFASSLDVLCCLYANQAPIIVAIVAGIDIPIASFSPRLKPEEEDCDDGDELDGEVLEVFGVFVALEDGLVGFGDEDAKRRK